VFPSPDTGRKVRNRTKEWNMQETWRQRATVGIFGLALGLSVLLPIATARSTGPADSVERQTIEQTAYDDMGRAQRGSKEFPTPGTPKLTCLDDYATRHTEWCQDWVMRLIRRNISPYDEDAHCPRP
jgi:hypothetical protein